MTQKPNSHLAALRSFFGSAWFIALQMLLAGVITIFGWEVSGAIVFIYLFTFVFFFCDDVTVTTLPFLLLSMTLIKCFNSFYTFLPLLPLALPAIIGFIVFAVRTKGTNPTGESFRGIVAVAAAITLGGVGVISAKAYFSATSMYYTFGLGIGMALIYIFMNNRMVNDEKNSLGEKFALIMTLVTAFASFMVLCHYAENIEVVLEKDSIIPFQWRNNISTFLMFGLPFPFYLSRKKWAVSLIGWVGYACLLLAGSRGGMIFGTVELGLCVLLVLINDKKHRKQNFIVLAVLLAVAAVFSRKLIHFYYYTIQRILDYNENKTRLGLFERATEDFSANPLFGRGLAYWGNRDIHPSKRFALCWYHSSPFQIIGSFGIMGVLCFGYRFFVRLRLIFRRANFFTFTMAISFLGITMMSLVNPGEFCPLPYELITTMIFVVLEKTPVLAKTKCVVRGTAI